MRNMMEIVEGRVADTRPWAIERVPLFKETHDKARTVFPDIDSKLEKFIDLKLPNPIDPSRRFGKHDSPFSALLKGFWHCHLRDDAVLIYKLQDRKIKLIAVVPHADMERSRLRLLAKKLAPYL